MINKKPTKSPQSTKIEKAVLESAKKEIFKLMVYIPMELGDTTKLRALHDRMTISKLVKIALMEYLYK